MEKLTNIIEGILFASGDAVPVDLLREKLGVSKRDVDTAIRQLEKKYSEDCGIRLLNFNHKLQFATNPDYKDTISLVLTPIREKEFTKTILECAAIIAYKQPVTRVEIEEIRGVGCDMMIKKLLARNLIRESGRLDVVGKPFQYEVTEEFMDMFKLASLSELPQLPEYQQTVDEEGELFD